jgi:peptidoglycan/LPS O-acetylase OafA/YrhL
MTQAFDECSPAAPSGDATRPAQDDVQALATRSGSQPSSASEVTNVIPIVTVIPPADEKVSRPAPRSGGPNPGRRLSGLDGLRAFAVLSVVVFHLDFSLSPGGFLGVDVFFVISGFLITNLIATEILASGRFDLRNFYIRRARRLLPTVFVLIVAIALVSETIWHDQLATLTGGALSSLGYVTNWWLIADHQDYFVSAGRPTMFQHLWSLAIEEQYYVVWSLVILAVAGTVFAIRRAMDPARRLRLVVVIAAVLAGVSTGIMAFYANAQDLPYRGSTSRVYFGSDTHSMGLFLGSAAGALAALLVSRPGSPTRKRARFVSITDVVGMAALGVVVYEFFAVNEYRPGLYRGGFLLFDAVVLAVILCAVRSGSLFGRLLDIRPIRWIGQRSYSIYVWHWPVVVVTRPELDVHGPLFLVNTGRFVLILGLASLSYRYIEVPLRAGRWRLWEREPKSKQSTSKQSTSKQRPWGLGALVTTCVAAIALVLAATSGTTAPPANYGQTPPVGPVSHTSGVSGAHTGGGTGQSRGHHKHRHPNGTPTHRHKKNQSPSGHHSKHPAPPGGQHSSHPKPPPPPSISAFGDSVLLGAQYPLGQDTRHLKLDAVEGRQAYDVLDDIASQARAGTLEPDVLIHIGDNGIIDPSQLKSTLQLLRNKRVVMMTVRVPREWQDSNNQIIRAAAAQFPNVTLVDWYALSANHIGSWLYSDGIHLTPDGAIGYTNIVLGAFGAAPH